MTGKFKFGDQVVYDNGKEKVEGIFQRKFGGTKSSIMTQSSMVVCEDSEISPASEEGLAEQSEATINTKCKHEKFCAFVEVDRLSRRDGGEITGYGASVKIKCDDCGTPFRFMGLKYGRSKLAPTVSASATELRAPIEPAYVLEVLGIPSVSGNA